MLKSTGQSNVIIIFKKKLQRWKVQCQRYDCFLVQIIMITFGGSTRTVIEWGIQWKCLKKQTCAICLKIRMIGDIKWSPIQLVPHFSTIWTPFYKIITFVWNLIIQPRLGNPRFQKLYFNGCCGNNFALIWHRLINIPVKAAYGSATKWQQIYYENCFDFARQLHL